jgi:thiamine-phosphate pyrophosphorylase
VQKKLQFSCLELCLVTQPKTSDLSAYFHFLERAIQGGVTSVQLRDKTASSDVFEQTAYAVKKQLAPLNIPLILNDRLDIAHAIDADGVHLGQTDASPSEARRILGLDKIIGWSIESLDELDMANELDLDYVAASAVFPSKTKHDCKTYWGLEGLHQLVQKSKHPVVAIGGIDARNARDVMRQGASGVAVVHALHDANDPFLAAQDLLHQIRGILPM